MEKGTLEKKFFWNKTSTKKVLPLIIEKIIKFSDPKKIILFGSYAKGEETSNSDIDLLIVKNNINSKKNESLKVRKYLRNFIFPKDIIIVSSEEYNFYKSEVGSVVYDAEMHGNVLYEKAV